MLQVHVTYNTRRAEKLRGMFGNDARQGNEALYVRRHFDLKRICESCGRRTSSPGVDVASVIVEGPDWVVPFSICTAAASKSISKNPFLISPLSYGGC